MLRAFASKPARVFAPLLAWLAFLAAGVVGAAPAQEKGIAGISHAPFRPDHREAATLSDPESVVLGHQGGVPHLRHFVAFKPGDAPVEIAAPLPRHGAGGASYLVALSGRIHLAPGGKIELAVLHEGKKILSRLFEKEGMTPFIYPAALWGGEDFRIKLTALPGTQGRVENLVVDYPAPTPPESPGMLNYYRREPIPLEVLNRNTHRYIQVLNRDLKRLSRILYYGLVYLLAIVAGGLLARRFFQASRKAGKSLKYIKNIKLCSFASLAACGLLILLLLAELLYRIGVCFGTGEPVFLTYPLGFNLTDLTHIYYERENAYRFNTRVGDTLVNHITHGKEITYHSTFFYNASINEGGFRGRLAPLPTEARTVFCIGGSSTYGMIRDGETFPEYLQALLDRSGDGEFKVFNLGIPGLAASGFPGRVEHVLNVKPDYLIVYAGFNDMNVQESELYAVEQDVIRRKLLFGPAHYFLLFRNLLAAMLRADDRMIEPRISEFNRLTTTDLNVLLMRAETYAREIDRVFAHAAASGARVIYVNEYAAIGAGTSLSRFQSITSGEGGRGILERSLIPKYEKALLTMALLQIQVRKLVEEKGYTHVVCMEPRCFEGVDPKEVLVDWVHLNAEGNQRLGECIGEKLLTLEERRRKLEEEAAGASGRNLLADVGWSHPPSVSITREGEGDLVTCALPRFAISKAIPDPGTLSGADALHVRLAVAASQPMVHLEARLAGPSQSMSLTEGGVFFSKGENTFTWVRELLGARVKPPLRLELSFSGSNRDTAIRILRLEAFAAEPGDVPP